MTTRASEAATTGARRRTQTLAKAHLAREIGCWRSRLPRAPCRDFDNDDIDADEPLDNEGEEGEEGEEGDQDGAEQGVLEVGDAPDDGVAGHAVDKDDRITTPYMTKYERARILGTRALQIRCPRT